MIREMANQNNRMGRTLSLCKPPLGQNPDDEKSEPNTYRFSPLSLVSELSTKASINLGAPLFVHDGASVTDMYIAPRTVTPTQKISNHLPAFVRKPDTTLLYGR
jgi:hypothetical protein